ncbi:MAG TPA: hydrogenase maturation protease [Candidatus Paceibacterota bacterium]|nr:hydrogenase maturation protease [Verrucomicrobiota bacterium]HRY47391.1 hydrogenase maturation protease [Candidatus Paceibacterota bacterium]HSA00969.1 hydrogenase maturation protease [Candidatus Paceibacterota bacterium]
MLNLRTELARICRGRICVVGLGNPEHGDDGLGLWLAGQVAARLPSPAADPLIRRHRQPPPLSVILAGLELERHLIPLIEGRFDRVLLIDAVDSGASPGSVVLLAAHEIKARFPQVSTHRISLGLLAQWLEMNGVPQVWLLGIQPGSLRPGHACHPAVEQSRNLVWQWLMELFELPAPLPPTGPPQPLIWNQYADA